MTDTQHMKSPGMGIVAKLMVALVPLMSAGVILTSTDLTALAALMLTAAYSTLALVLQVLLYRRPDGQLQVFACACFAAIAIAYLMLSPAIDTGAVVILMRRLFEAGLLTLVMGLLGLGANHTSL